MEMFDLSALYQQYMAHFSELSFYKIGNKAKKEKMTEEEYVTETLAPEMVEHAEAQTETSSAVAAESMNETFMTSQGTSFLTSVDGTKPLAYMAKVESIPGKVTITKNDLGMFEENPEFVTEKMEGAKAIVFEVGELNPSEAQAFYKLQSAASQQVVTLVEQTGPSLCTEPFMNQALTARVASQSGSTKFQMPSLAYLKPPSAHMEDPTAPQSRGWFDRLKDVISDSKSSKTTT
jgi:hypothetical protein